MNGAADAVLPLEFYSRDPVRVARDLLGRRLICRQAEDCTSGIIVETEAYLAQDDSACHAARGRNHRNAAMFGPPGRAYVYCIHTHFCLNLVTEPEGVASAVLIRALEPVTGLEIMKARRKTDRLADLTNGPGKLCQAMGITTKTWNHWDLTLGQGLWVDTPSGYRAPEIVTTNRIGVTSAHDLPLRFFVAGNSFVSKGRPQLQPSHR